MTSRLKSGLWVRALLRRTALHGHSAMVLHRGDEDAGAVIVVLMDRRRQIAVLREAPSFADNEPDWARIAVSDPAELDSYLERQRRYDPDLWVIELEVTDVKSPVEDDLGTRRAEM
ncbi:DUF1491 family protein [Brytella acorum]|uniref:DUF1491 family protein n=1 Tax=Brytella acorum TaxID=2959299 RepID=A0AA35Y364_9PROT|nr:DUF1491 family protein [Brytella acorum]MDF3623664.1 DUF1491 family protein [Brytella acorum]CAI9119918.1 DUF1491 family protein [Brytella acorum]